MSTNGADEVYSIQNHPIYYFSDGSLILDVVSESVQRFKVHRTLLSRHSRFFSTQSQSSLKAKANSTAAGTTRNLVDETFPLGALNAGDAVAANLGNATEVDVDHIILEPSRQVKAADVEALLRHLYHDAPLGKDSSFNHAASILRISSPQQLDFPSLHASAQEILEHMFSSSESPRGFHEDTQPLHDALSMATNFNLPFVRKAILYSLVTTTEFDVSDSNSATTSAETLPVDPQTSFSSPSEPEARATGYPSTHLLVHPDLEPESIAPTIVGAAASAKVDSHPSPSTTPTEGPDNHPTPVLSAADASVCMSLMTRLIAHFTPILFTPAATPHMACTDVFADKWMPLVIQPALEDDGVYKPLETLERIKQIDWAKEGLCEECCGEKREEWSEEQRTVWRLMDGWLER